MHLTMNLRDGRVLEIEYGENLLPLVRERFALKDDAAVPDSLIKRYFEQELESALNKVED